MNEFMMLFRHEQMDCNDMPSAEQMQAMMKLWQDWIGSIAAQGKYSSTNRLDMTGKTIMPDGAITDGPYMELKEMVGGYLIVKANSMDEAMEMAKQCPNLAFGGNVEVRPVLSIDYDVKSSNFLEII